MDNKNDDRDRSDHNTPLRFKDKGSPNRSHGHGTPINNLKTPEGTQLPRKSIGSHDRGRDRSPREDSPGTDPRQPKNKWADEDDDRPYKNDKYGRPSDYYVPGTNLPGRDRAGNENDPNPRRKVREDDPEYRVPEHYRKGGENDGYPNRRDKDDKSDPRRPSHRRDNFDTEPDYIPSGKEGVGSGNNKEPTSRRAPDREGSDQRHPSDKSDAKYKPNSKSSGGAIDPEPEDVHLNRKDKNGPSKYDPRGDSLQKDKHHELNPDDEMDKNKPKQRKPRPEKLDPFRQKIYNEMPKHLKGSENDQEGPEHHDSTRPENSKYRHDEDPYVESLGIPNEKSSKPQGDKQSKPNDRRYSEMPGSRGSENKPYHNDSDFRSKDNRRHSEMPGVDRKGKIDFTEEASKNKKPSRSNPSEKDARNDRDHDNHDVEYYEEDDRDNHGASTNSQPKGKPNNKEDPDFHEYGSGRRNPDNRRYSEMPNSKDKKTDRRYSEMPRDDNKNRPSKPSKPDSSKTNKNYQRDEAHKDMSEDDGYDDHPNNQQSEDENNKRPGSLERKSILKKKEPGQPKDREDSKSKGVVFREDVKPDQDSEKGKNQNSKPKNSFKVTDPEGGVIDESEVVGVHKKPGDAVHKDHKRNSKIVVTESNLEEDDKPTNRRQSHSDKNMLMPPGANQVSDSSEEEEPLPGRDVVNIPVKTYSRMRNLKSLSKNLDEDLKECDPEDPENQEVIEEQATKVADLGESIMKDLVENNPENKFIQKLDEEFKEITNEVKKPDQTEEEKQKSIEKLVKWQKKLKKLEVKEAAIKPEEKKQLRDMYKRKSFMALVDGDSPGKEVINSTKIQEGLIDERTLEEYVRAFLGKYSEKMEEMDSPYSRMFAKESNQALKTLDVVKEEKPTHQSDELIKLIANTIYDKFKSKNQDLLSSMANDDDLRDKSSLEFNHFLRAVNNLSAIPFKTLDDIITEPSTKINLFNIRKDKMTKFSDIDYKDKDADLLKLNSLEKDKDRIEELFINLGKEVLPPEQVKKNTNMYDSGMGDMDINFIPISTDKGKDLPKAVAEPGFTKTIDSDDSFGQDIKFGGTNYEETAVQKRFSMVQPNLIDSEAELDESSDDPKEKSTPPPPESLRAGIDYRDDLADKLELIIEGITNTISDTKIARQEIKKHNRSKTPLSDAEKIEIFDQLNKALEESNSLSKEGDQFKVPYENLKRDIKEKLNIESTQLPSEHNRGLIKMWGKYNRQLRKLKDETVSLLSEIQSSPGMQANEPQTADELELIKEQLEEVQKALQSDSEQEDNQTQTKQNSDPNQHIIIAPDEVEKEVKEQDKKHKEMDKKVESLSGKIENLRRASMMHPHLDPHNKKNHRLSTISGPVPTKPKDKKSIIHALIHNQREEEHSEGEVKIPEDITEEEQEEDDQDLEIEKDLQKLKSQTVAAITSLNTDEESDEAVRRLEKTIDDPKMVKIIEAAGGQKEMDELKQALEDKDDQAIKPKIEALYKKMAKAQISPEKAKEIEEAVAEEDENLDEEAKMDKEIKKRREAKQREEKEVKNIKDIVEQLKSELGELRGKSEALETIGKRQPTKLRHVKKNIDECKDHLKQTPMPAPSSISQIKQTSRDADSLLPTNEELTPEIIADIEEFEALTNQIQKNVDQLAVNMTDVGEFRLQGSTDLLVDIGKDKGLDLKAPTRGGTAPENSEKLTKDDREELQKALDKVKRDAEEATKIVEEW